MAALLPILLSACHRPPALVAQQALRAHFPSGVRFQILAAAESNKGGAHMICGTARTPAGQDIFAVSADGSRAAIFPLKPNGYLNEDYWKAHRPLDFQFFQIGCGYIEDPADVRKLIEH